MCKRKPIWLVTLLGGALFLAACSGGGSLPDSQRLVGDSRVNMRSANTYMNIEEFDRALERYLDVIEDNPEYIEALKMVGDINFFYAEDRPAEATEFYREAFGYYERAIVAYDKVSREGTIRDLKVMVDDAELKRRAAWARMFNANQRNLTQENYEEALEGFYNLAELTPDSTNIFVMIASAHQNMGDAEKAAEYFEKIASMDREDVVSRKNLAMHHFGLNEYQEALHWYEEVIELEDDNPDNYYMIAIVHMSLDNSRKALENFEKAYEYDNEFADAIINAANVAYNLGEFDKAIHYYKEMVELEPENEEVLLFLLYALNSEERYEEMLVYAQKLYERNNQSIEAVQFIILAASRTKNTALQTEFLKRLNELD